MPLLFNGSEHMTLGAELELQILDGSSRDLRPAAPEILDRIGGEQPHIKQEIFQSIVEINTGIHSDGEGVRSDLAACIRGFAVRVSRWAWNSPQLDPIHSRCIAIRWVILRTGSSF